MLDFKHGFLEKNPERVFGNVFFLRGPVALSKVCVFTGFQRRKSISCKRMTQEAKKLKKLQHRKKKASNFF